MSATGPVIMKILVSLTAVGWLIILWWLVPRLIYFAKWVVREIKVARKISLAAEGIPPETVRSMIAEIMALGTVQPNGCIVGYSRAAPATGRFELALPKGIPDFPWSGQVVTANFTDFAKSGPVAFAITPAGETAPDGLQDTIVFWPPRLEPKGKAKTGKHVFSVRQYLKLLPDLDRRLADLCPGHSVDLLDHVLHRHAIRRNEFDIRVGLSPVWIQEARFHKCSQCHKPMRLVVQLPGDLIHKRLGDGSFFLFGCTRHPDETVAEQDWY